MRISEGRLRRIIRNILAEGYAESGELGDSEDIPHSTDTHGGSLDDALSMSDEYTDLDSEYDTRNDKKRYRPRRKTNPDINW
jgi:hypothetical protein